MVDDDDVVDLGVCFGARGWWPCALCPHCLIPTWAATYMMQLGRSSFADHGPEQTLKMREAAAKASQLYRNPFDVERKDLLSQVCLCLGRERVEG